MYVLHVHISTDTNAFRFNGHSALTDTTFFISPLNLGFTVSSLLPGNSVLSVPQKVDFKVLLVEITVTAKDFFFVLIYLYSSCVVLGCLFICTFHSPFVSSTASVIKVFKRS